MKMDRRLSNGLAWAGALLVVGVPAADYLIGRFEQGQSEQVAVVDAGNSLSTAEPVDTETAGADSRPGETAVAADKDAVQNFIDSGRPLPSYITGEDVPAAAAPVEVAKAPEEAETAPAPAVVTPSPAAPVAATTPPASETRPPIETVAAVPPKVAPIPMPLSMRPKAPVAIAPSTPPLIIDEPVPVAQPSPAPGLQPAPIVVEPQGLVTAEDLESWETGPLSDFLAQRQRGSSATYRVQPSTDGFESDGFWLDEQPSSFRQNRNFPPAYEDGPFLPVIP